MNMPTPTTKTIEITVSPEGATSIKTSGFTGSSCKAATRELVQQVVADLGVAGDPSATGRVMGALMKAHKDELDGALVNQVVREVLAG